MPVAVSWWQSRSVRVLVRFLGALTDDRNLELFSLWPPLPPGAGAGPDVQRIEQPMFISPLFPLQAILHDFPERLSI